MQIKCNRNKRNNDVCNALKLHFKAFVELFGQVLKDLKIITQQKFDEIHNFLNMFVNEVFNMVHKLCKNFQLTIMNS